MRAIAFFLILVILWVAIWAAELIVFPESNGTIGGAAGLITGLLAAFLVTGIGAPARKRN
jgi:hypothetical protein